MRCVTLYWLAILVNDELGKVPLDGISKEPMLLLLQVLPQRVSGRAIDIDLAEHVKLDVELACKLLDLCISAGLLTPELIAWKCKDAQSLGLCKLLVKLHELRVVFVGHASLGCHIDN